MAKLINVFTKKRGKEIEKAVKKIYEKADARVESGSEPMEASLQAALETYFLLMKDHLLDNPGQLLPMQIDDQNEWDFYLDIQEKLDLPPDTWAILVAPSAFKTISFSISDEAKNIGNIGTTPWERNAYWILISDCQNQKKIMQVSLPGLQSVGMDVFEDGKMIGNYTYRLLQI